MGVGGGADGPLDGSLEQLLGSDSLAAKSNFQDSVHAARTPLQIKTSHWMSSVPWYPEHR